MHRLKNNRKRRWTNILLRFLFCCLSARKNAIPNPRRFRSKLRRETKEIVLPVDELNEIGENRKRVKS